MPESSVPAFESLRNLAKHRFITDDERPGVIEYRHAPQECELCQLLDENEQLNQSLAGYREAERLWLEERDELWAERDRLRKQVQILGGALKPASKSREGGAE